MSYQDMQNVNPGKVQAMAVFLLILVLALFQVVAWVAEKVPMRQLEPLPSLETPPDYKPFFPRLDFVHF